MKKIYTKIVRERREAFQIETSIRVENQNKYVVKRNLVPEGAEHIKRVEETFEQEKHTNLLCPCFVKNGEVYFEFLKGVSLGQRLLDAIVAGDIPRIEEIVQKYEEIINTLCKDKEKETISNNKNFSEVFGEAFVQPDEEPEYGYRNLIFDLTFDNIIFQNDVPQIIDYEWRFSFPVPVEFIKFRAVYAFEMKYRKYIERYYTEEQFYHLFGVDKNKEEKYLAYNYAFIKFVYGENGYNDILRQYRKENLNINILTRAEAFEKSFYHDLLEIIKEHKDLFDDYEKFFRVTNKIKEQGITDYLFTEEFCKEFHLFLEGNFDMIEFYKGQLEKKDRRRDTKKRGEDEDGKKWRGIFKERKYRRERS